MQEGVDANASMGLCVASQPICRLRAARRATPHERPATWQLLLSLYSQCWWFLFYHPCAGLSLLVVQERSVGHYTADSCLDLCGGCHTGSSPSCHHCIRHWRAELIGTCPTTICKVP